MAASGASRRAAGALFLQLLAILAHAQCLLGDRSAYPPDTARPLPEYDFVVVGAGSAGCAVAARLSENPAWTVLLLEAGGDPPPTSDVPRLFPTLQKTEADWGFLTEPGDRSGLGLEGGSVPWPRGKALGGSSSVGGMAHVRGSPQDYDGWAALGNEGWSYREVLRFFRKLEAFDEEELRRRPSASAVHGRKGPIPVHRVPNHGPATDALKAAARELGFRLVDDFSTEPLDGFGEFHLNIRNGTRVNAARGYLGTAEGRENLHVVKHARVTKVLIDPESRVAYGVQYLKDGETREVKMTNEVVLSAGAINTPHILMLSGIGPKDHLDDIGIPVLRNLQVGYNLQDHVTYTGLFYTRKGATQNVLKEAEDEYSGKRTGFLSGVGDWAFTGFVQTEIGPGGTLDLNSTKYPDVQFHFFMLEAAYPEWKTEFVRACNYKKDVAEALMQATEGLDALLVLPSLLAPVSRGRVLLASADPMKAPLLQPDYLSHEADADRLLAGIKLARQLGETAAMREAGFSVLDAPLAECGSHQALTDGYWRCAASYLTGSLHHAAGSAKMGPASDADAVVDSRLRVYGVRNVRVADASVMPVIVRADTNAAAIMIGEKCAHMLARDWRHDSHGKKRKRQRQPKTEL